ncbi:hypothetical protein [Leptospira noguchii]|nr:hypothetical protein [Leptospira noguchii]
MKNSEGIGAKTNNSASRFYGRSTGREPILAMKFASCDDDP